MTRTSAGTDPWDVSLNADLNNIEQRPVLQHFRPLRAACIGTSIYAGGLKTMKDETVDTGSTWSAANMDRYSQNPGGQSWFTWMCLLSGGRIMHYYNGGEASSTSESWITRYLSEIVPKKPDICFFGDATNDINDGFTDAEIRANIATLISQSIANNIVPILVSTNPTSDSAKNIRTRLHNEWLMRYAWSQKIRFIDPFSAIVDPASTTSYPLAGTTLDGLHPNENGAKLCGQRAVDQLAGMLPGPVSPSVVPWIVQNRVNGISNLLLNPLFQDDINTDSNADNWTVSTGGGKTLATDSRVLGKLQGLTVNGSNQSISRDTSVDTTNIDVGDRLALSGLIEVANTSSLQWNVGIVCLGQTGNWSSHAIGYGGGGPVGYGLALAPFYCEITVPTGCTIVRSILLGQSGTGTLATAQWRLINLTKNGLNTIY